MSIYYQIRLMVKYFMLVKVKEIEFFSHLTDNSQNDKAQKIKEILNK